MADEAKKKEILEKLRNGVIQYDEDACKEGANEALAAGLDANEAIFDGLVSGMEEVGRLFEAQEYFVPEILMCADALYAGLDILKPHCKQMDLGIKGSVVIGTVEGDVHDIGRDVPLDKFVEEQLKTDSELVCLSAMMTTSMVGMPKVIEKIKAKNPDCMIMIGGAPTSKELADKWGADGYAEDASNALKEAIKMVAFLKKLRDEKAQKK